MWVWVWMGWSVGGSEVISRRPWEDGNELRLHGARRFGGGGERGQHEKERRGRHEAAGAAIVDMKHRDSTKRNARTSLSIHAYACMQTGPKHTYL